jgi:thiosulfate dehydrogenase
MKNKFLPSFTTIFMFVFLLLVLLFFLHAFYEFSPGKTRIERAVAYKQKREAKGMEKFEFKLVDPGQAPEKIRDTIRLGYKIMLNTPEYAPEYAGDRLSCTNCHFAGGDTTGGKGNGISLVGVAAKYPHYNERKNGIEDLGERINDCFEKSLNGYPLPLDSPEMLAILTYLHWISKSTPIYGQTPWLGLPHLETKHTPNIDNGKKVYNQQCALCHGKEGLGEVHVLIPPLWGPESFNDAAGMCRESTMAAFIHTSMPYEEPKVSINDAFDVAAFILQQPRPKYGSKQ